MFNQSVTSVCNNIKVAHETGFANFLDIVGYNYRERFYEEEHKSYPDRKIIGSETVDYLLSVWLANEKTIMWPVASYFRRFLRL